MIRFGFGSSLWKHPLLPLVAVILTHLIVTRGASAQAPGSNGNFVTRFSVNYREFETVTGLRWHKLTVAQFPAVQADLMLDDEKLATLKAVLEEAGTYVRNGGPGPDRARPASREEAAKLLEKVIDEVTKTYDPKIDELLNEQQKRRLDQLVLQAQGIDALRRPEIVQQLGLTTEQTIKLNEIEESFRTGTAELKEIRVKDFEMARARQAKLMELNVSRKNSLKKLLTMAQQEKLSVMGGPPFDTSWFNVSP